MIGAYGYLVVRSARNRLGRQLARLRNPRYLVAVLLGLAYLYLVVIHQRPHPGPPSGASRRWVELLLAAGVALAIAWAWVIGSERKALAFSPAEVTFLFAGPVTRRQLIQFKLLVSQTVVLFNVALWTVVLARERFGVSAWLRAASLWILLTTLSFHRLGASFVRTSLLEHGRHGARRRLVSLALAGTLLLTVVWTVAGALPALRGAWRFGLGAFLAALGGAAENPVASVVLAPFRLMVRPLLAPTAAEWVRAVGPAVAILAAHFVWVVRSDAAFEEAAADASLARARRAGRGGTRAGAEPVVRSRVPLPPLAATGWPAAALAWKTTVGAVRSRRARTVVLAFSAGAVLALWLATLADPAPAEALGWMAAMWAGFLLLAGPQWVRNDLRGDLLKLDLLRSYPLRGSAVVAAETASSALVLTALQLGLLGIAYVAFLGDPAAVPALPVRSGLLAAALLALPPVNFLGMLIHNGAALLFPTWAHLGSGRPSGVEALGQNMLVLTGFVLLLGVALLPPAALGAGLGLVLEPSLGDWAALPAGAAVLAATGGEAVMLVRWLGGVFERLDPAAAALPA